MTFTQLLRLCMSMARLYVSVPSARVDLELPCGS